MRERLGDGDLIAEVRQENHDAVDLVPVLAEEIGIALRFLARLHGAVRRLAGGKDERLDLQPG